MICKFMQALCEKYPPVGSGRHTLYYNYEKSCIGLNMYVNHYPYTFLLGDSDFEDIPKLLDGIDQLTTGPRKI